MRRLLARFIVALLTFAIGISAAWLRHTLRRPSPVGSRPTAALSPPPAHSRPERKYPETDGHGVLQDGTPYAFSGVYTSDGVGCYRTSEYHTSPERAGKALRKALEKAARILEREPLFDRAGVEVGEKVIASFPSEGLGHESASLLWTDGSAFRYINNLSLETILAHEEEFTGRPR
jgi:hypothetical protein